MQTFMKKIAMLLVALCALCSVRAAEEVTFTANLPMIAAVGEAVRVEFVLSAKPDDNSFVPPSFDNFDVVAGPAVSTGSSIQIINGKTTRSESYTITYVLLPRQSGNFTIGAAIIAVKGRNYSTSPMAVEVRENKGSSQAQGGEAGASNQIGEDDLLLRLSLSRQTVYKGEPLRAMVKLYSRVNIAGSEGAKMPSFGGFWSQQLDVEQGPFRENYNGKVYEVYNLAEYLLYPQQSGVITIEPAEITIVAQVMVQTSRRGFNPFFDMGHEVYNVRRALRSPAVKLQVKELPAGAPASFAGAVGRYTMSQKVSSTDVAANSAVTLTLKISGSGNLSFVQAPKLNLPASFELYDVKSSEKIENSRSGSIGYRQFDYPFIARAEGEYHIEPVEFSYFDTETQRYCTLRAEPLDILVRPDTSAAQQAAPSTVGVKREDVRLLGSDIRFIMLGTPMLRSRVAPLVLSPLYFALLALLVVLAIVAYFVVRKMLRDRSNVVLVRGRRANRVAVQRFRKAAKYMQEEDRRAFYEEILRALWGYLSDRFNIPVADLTKESVSEELVRRGAEAEAERIIAIISQCEEAQYSPIASAQMSDIYADGIEIVSQIESVIKR